MKTRRRRGFREAGAVVVEAAIFASVFGLLFVGITQSDTFNTLVSDQTLSEINRQHHLMAGDDAILFDPKFIGEGAEPDTGNVDLTLWTPASFPMFFRLMANLWPALHTHTMKLEEGSFCFPYYRYDAGAYSEYTNDMYAGSGANCGGEPNRPECQAAALALHQEHIAESGDPNVRSHIVCKYKLASPEPGFEAILLGAESIG